MNVEHDFNKMKKEKRKKEEKTLKFEPEIS